MFDKSIKQSSMLEFMPNFSKFDIYFGDDLKDKLSEKAETFYKENSESF